MTDTLVKDLRVIDTDTHVTEPPDLWTSRVPAACGTWCPPRTSIRDTGHHHWQVAGHWLPRSGFYAVAGLEGVPPDGPIELEEPASIRDPGIPTTA